jgi:hypothetical protein
MLQGPSKEWFLADLMENQIEFVHCFAFMQSDASVTYAATISAISCAKRYAVIFRNNVKAFADGVDFPGKKIVAEAVHNPKPLKNKIDRVASEEQRGMSPSSPRLNPLKTIFTTKFILSMENPLY